MITNATTPGKYTPRNDTSAVATSLSPSDETPETGNKGGAGSGEKAAGTGGRKTGK